MGGAKFAVAFVVFDDELQCTRPIANPAKIAPNARAEAVLILSPSSKVYAPFARCAA
jgi:hypothetical protein